MSSENDIFFRFKKERQRLKLSHARVAEICNVAKTSVIAWERGTKIPSDALVALMKDAEKFDVFYVLAGRYKDAPQPIMLEPDEVVLIDGYRSLNDEDQQWFRLMIDAKVNQSAAKGTNKTLKKGEEQNEQEVDR